jgi:AcrR family transcriptional regulator
MPAENSQPNKENMRERKKGETRARLQEVALNLFEKNGYAGTTVEQIARGADVSFRTFFRYFPSKEDLVLFDAYDSPLASAIMTSPKTVGAIQAIRDAVIETYGKLSPVQRSLAQVRHELIMKEPELRMRYLARTMEEMTIIERAIADRSGSRTDELAIQTMAGAIIGVSISILFGAIRSREFRLSAYLTSLDKGLMQLEKRWKS